MLTFSSAYLQGKRRFNALVIFQRATSQSHSSYAVPDDYLKAGHETKKHLFRCFKVFAVAKQN